MRSLAPLEGRLVSPDPSPENVVAVTWVVDIGALITPVIAPAEILLSPDPFPENGKQLCIRSYDRTLRNRYFDMGATILMEVQSLDGQLDKNLPFG